MLVFASLLLFSNCAKKGRPSGGPKDTIPPVIVKSNPENYTTNFTGNEIRIYFDEYIKLKELQKNLVISPPLKSTPIITPLSTAKVLKIKILDTLLENTTYAINFGKSIQDNNEDNAFEDFKYVFSTGSYIDSLSIKGIVKDALLLSPEKPATVMLYERNETFTDSIIYKDKPTYIATSNEKDGSFELSNLKEGTYLLIALEEENSDYIFQPSKDKIGYLEAPVSTPNDSSYALHIFKEAVPYQITRPSHVSKNKIVFGFEGPGDELELEPLFETPEDYTSIVFKTENTDSLQYFFKPAFDIEKQDSLYFLAKNKLQVDTVLVKMKDLFADSLKVSRIGGASIIPRDSIHLSANNPLVRFNADSILIMNKDSLMIKATTSINTSNNKASIVFDKEDDQQYNIQILPGALEDFFENTNDSIRYVARSAPENDYGNITFNIQNAKNFPIIVELVDSKFNVVQKDYLTSNEPSYFDYLKPNNYYIRIIYDENENGVWDTGDFLLKKQPEPVLYYPSQLEVRANWSLPETFILD